MRHPTKDHSAVSLGLGLVTVVLVGVIGLLLWNSRTEDPLTQALAGVGARITVHSPSELLRAEAKEGRLQTALAAIGEDRLRVRVFDDHDPASAQKLSSDMRAQFLNLFGDRQAPYPGQLSQTLTCPERFLPVELETSNSMLLQMQFFANARFGYGGCDESLLAYRSTMGLFYFPESRLFFQVEYFEPAQEDELNGPQVLASFGPMGGAR
jgi:hypothetical protein